MFNSLNKLTCSIYNIKLHHPFAAIQSNPIHPSFSNIRPNPIQPNPWMHPICVQLWNWLQGLYDWIVSCVFVFNSFITSFVWFRAAD